MNLLFQPDLATEYRSRSQRVRVMSEEWLFRNVFCPNCARQSLDRHPNNQPGSDFHCFDCGDQYELKSKGSIFGRTVADGAYLTMIERLESSSNPNLFLLEYTPATHTVLNLAIVPRQFFTTACIQQRPPLGPGAKRAGWVGCNILLQEIPRAGIVSIVRAGQPRTLDDVRNDWEQVRFLRRRTRPETRRWIVETMRCIDKLGADRFRLADLYAFEPRLQHLFPDNGHIRAKLRQQLQLLRDEGVLLFLGAGTYRLRSRAS